jgi:hypothetical protein
VSPRTALALAALCLAATGCARDDDRRAAGDVTERFLAAVEAQDGAAACAQLSEATADALARDEGEPCVEAAPQLDVAPSAVARVQVYAIGAKVELADGESAFLELTETGWRIAAAGCVPAGAGQPYDCEVEA